MIYTALADITPLLNDEVYEQYYSQLPNWRKEKADKCKFADGQAQSVGAWILYQKLKEKYGFEDNQVYNLSHAGKYALCSVYTGEKKSVKVGCDVETIKGMHHAIIKRFFCLGEENAILGQSSKEEQKEEFYRYWVLKESFIKAIRKGMGQDLREFEVRMDEYNHPFLGRQPRDFQEKYFYHEYAVPDGDAKIAVCSTHSRFSKLEIYEL